MIKSVKDLKPSEKFFLMRRRHKISNKQAAIQYKVTPDVITFWESGRLSAPNITIRDPLTPGERFIITRRRAGLTINQAAEMLGINRLTVINHEKDRNKEPERIILRLHLLEKLIANRVQ